MNVFGMITTSKSNEYTPFAVKSFFRCTPFANEDKFFLIDNDGDFPNFPLPKPVQIIRNSNPKSFAANANDFIYLAKESKADLYLLNNDLIFAPYWFAPLAKQSPESIVSCISNTKPLTLDEYLEKEIYTLNQLAEYRSSNFTYQKVLCYPFFCVKIPYQIYTGVGEFDTSFGIGGAEDNDYCLRAYLEDYNVLLAQHSYVLHFQGKSTWGGAETENETAIRNRKYQEIFESKWGKKLLYIAIFHVGGCLTENLELHDLWQKKHFKEVIKILSNEHNRNKGNSEEVKKTRTTERIG